MQAETRDMALDLRWIECKRPVVIPGGELTPEIRDRVSSPPTNVYEAPRASKAPFSRLPWDGVDCDP